MRRPLLVLLLALSAASLTAAPALAEGPGTRIRSGTDLPRVPDSRPRNPPANPCARLPDGAKPRCADEERKPVQTGRASGPEASGMGSGAGASSTSGTSGGGSFGASAPR